MKKKNLKDTETLKFFDKGVLKEAVMRYPTCCESTDMVVGTGYTMTSHTHEDGLIVINSFEVQEVSVTKPPKHSSSHHYCSAECRVS